MPFPARITAAVVTVIAAGAACTACALLTPAQPPPAPAHTTVSRAAAVRAVPGLALTRQPAVGWAVYDIEPATAGNAG